MRSHRRFLRTAALGLVALLLFGVASHAEEFSFGPGSRGITLNAFLQRLHARFPYKQTFQKNNNDFRYELYTAEVATAVGKLQTEMANGRLFGSNSSPGRIGKPEFTYLKLPWPDDIERSLQFIGLWENTFSSVEGPDESGDHDHPKRVTYGLVGFTSDDLYIQRLLWLANEQSKKNEAAKPATERNQAVLEHGAVIVEAGKIPELDAKHLAGMIREQGARDPESVKIKDQRAQYVDAFAAWAIVRIGEKRVVREPVKHFFKTITRLYEVAEEQLILGRKVHWEDQAKPAYSKRIFGRSSGLTPQETAFCINLTMNTNGPGKPGWAKLAAKQDATPAERMQQVMDVMNERAVSDFKKKVAGARIKCIADGSGIVNKERFNLRDYALLPFEKTPQAGGE